MSSIRSNSFVNISTMTVLFGVVLLCLIWGGLYFKVQSERQVEMDNAVAETANYTLAFAEHTVRTIRGLDEIALYLKHQMEEKGLFIDLKKLVAAGRFVDQPFVQLGVVDENGYSIDTTISPFVQVNIRDLEHFWVHRESDSGKAFIGKSIVGRTSGKWSIQLTRRINKADGSFGGVVVVSANPDYFIEFYKQVDLGTDSSITLLGRDGFIRVRQSGTEIVFGQDLRDSIVMKKVSESSLGSLVFQSPIDDIKRIYSYRALQQYPLIVVVGVSEARVFQDLNKRVVGYYWFCGIASVICILFGSVLLVGLTRRKHAEEALRESEERFANAFKYAAIGMALISPDGYWLKVNQSLCQLLDCSDTDLLGTPARDLIYFEDLDLAEKFRQQMVSGETEAYHSEIRFCNKSAQVVWTMASISQVRNNSGEMLYNVLQVEDISDRKRMEKELRMHADQMEEKVKQRTQELSASNLELMDANNELVLREKQYRAITSLLSGPGEDINVLLLSILNDAVQLVGAPGGEISLVDESGKYFIFPHAVGIKQGVNDLTQPIEEGMLGQVYQSGEILCVEDYRRYPKRINNPRFERLTTVLMVPLKQAGAVKGILTANWQDEVYPVTVEDIEVFRQYGTLASIVLEKVHAKQKITYQNELLQKLAETTAALLNELDWDKTLQNILMQAISFMEIPHGYISFFDPDGRQAQIKCGIGRYESRVGNFTHFDGKGVYAEVLRTGKLVVVEDYANWPLRWVGAFDEEMTSNMQAPLIVNGKIVGVIGLAAFGEPFRMDQEKLAVFEQFATVAAIAVKNALDYQQTNRLAYYDTLTGLPNRAQLNLHLEEEMNKARLGESAGALMFIDLDDLKNINDHFGHSYGDDMIVAAGKDIAGAVGDNAYVARAGGDEFVVILSGADMNRILQVAERLVGSIRKEYEIQGHRISMTTSIGITLYPVDATTAEGILKNADIAMYAAKAAGKNNWRFFEPGMLKDSYDQMVLTNSLRHALEKRELYLDYQPQIALPDRKLVGFEALLRWNSPAHGLIPPARFIPLAEKRGLIQPIGEWVIREACQFVRKLTDLGHRDLHVAVNVSPRQLAAANFVDMLHRSIETAGIVAEQLEVEITETVLIESLEDSTKKLLELSALGIRLSLDDFGTGYSSLTYLRNLPVKTLKIDKSFIDRMLDGENEERFIRSLIDMAHGLSLYVVAEGVETEPQISKLTHLGCDGVQGYVFSKPVSQEDAIQFSTSR